MTAPPGYGSVASRAALIALSLPRMARISLRLPASWATEINLQSRYPGGILIPKMGTASSSARPDKGAVEARTPATDAIATSQKEIRLIDSPLLYRVCYSAINALTGGSLNDRT